MPTNDDCKDTGTDAIEDAVTEFVRDNMDALATEGQDTFRIVADVANKVFTGHAMPPMTDREGVIAQAIVSSLVVKMNALVLGGALAAAGEAVAASDAAALARARARRP